MTRKEALGCADALTTPHTYSESKEAREAAAQLLRDVAGAEMTAFHCHGSFAPAYQCSKPGDQSGVYIKFPLEGE